MDGRMRKGGTRETLLRIAAVLFALADLGERRAYAPLPARMLLIWALRVADYLFKELVFDVSDDLPDDVWLPDLVEVGCGHDPAVVIDLALSLRSLALSMQVIAAYVDACSGPARACPRVRPHLHLLLSALRIALRDQRPALPLFDTS